MITRYVTRVVLPCQEKLKRCCINFSPKSRKPVSSKNERRDWIKSDLNWCKFARKSRPLMNRIWMGWRKKESVMDAARKLQNWAVHAWRAADLEIVTQDWGGRAQAAVNSTFAQVLEFQVLARCYVQRGATFSGCIIFRANNLVNPPKVDLFDCLVIPSFNIIPRELRRWDCFTSQLSDLIRLQKNCHREKNQKSARNFQQMGQYFLS